LDGETIFAVGDEEGDAERWSDDDVLEGEEKNRLTGKVGE
jgi:hypothetical protein